MTPERPAFRPAADAARRRRVRRDIVALAEHSAHVAVALSCVDILAALYFGVLRRPDPPPPPGAPLEGDLCILSKGHGAMALYAVLAEAGLLERSWLATYGRDGSPLAEHPLATGLPGVAFATGSLGHGLALGAGVAKGYQLRGVSARVFVVLGDGECDEGAVWESAAAARAQGLSHLTAVVDGNGLQACGARADISRGNSLADCWRGFGWEVVEADGHDVAELQEIFARPPVPDVPRAVLCRTVKGKGVPFMEGDLEWHYRPVRGADRRRALEELSDA